MTDEQKRADLWTRGLPIVLWQANAVFFGHPAMGWFRMTPENARLFAAELLAKADEAQNVKAAEAS